MFGSHRRHRASAGIAMNHIKEAGTALAGIAKGDFSGFLEWIAKTPRAIEDFAASLLDAQKDLKRFSGDIQGAFAELERGQMKRDIQSAGATGASTRQLAESYNELQDIMQPMRDDVAINYE